MLSQYCTIYQIIILKKFLSFLLLTIVCIIGISLLNVSEVNALGSNYEFEYHDNGGGGGSGTNSYYIPESWYSRIKNASQTSRILIKTKTDDKYVFPWYRNYHRYRWYNEGYTDNYITSKIFSVRHYSGVATYNLASSTAISETRSHNVKVTPEFKGFSLGGYEWTKSTTVSKTIGGGMTLTIGPDRPSGSYGFYTMNERKKYSFDHYYSRSNKTYDTLKVKLDNIYMFTYEQGDILFIYTGNNPLM